MYLNLASLCPLKVWMSFEHLLCSFHVSLACLTVAVLIVVSSLSILGRKLMAPDTVCLAGIVSGGAVPAPDILAHGDRFKVVGPDAMSYTAQVVDCEAVGDRADAELVRPAVGAGSLGIAE